ncbi:MAG TPA: DUF1517 domain-containing protein [Candidatus Limnocylindrales bacterium]|nr:DUF1517 domain-containing protein [Candidatus Limnocylindrales bacterium]
MFARYSKMISSWLLVFILALTSIPLWEGEVLAGNRTGGRVGGKSGFSRSSPSSSPFSNSYSRSRDYSSSDYSRSPNNTTYIPVPIGGGSPGFFYFGPRYYPATSTSMGNLLFWALVVGALVFVAVIILSRMNSRSSGSLRTPSKSLAAAQVIKFQLALLSAAKELQTELNKLAETVNTGDPTGLQQLLQETTLALIRHPDYWMQAGIEVVSTPSYEVAESKFDEWVMTERAKFSEETLTNVEGRVQKREAKPNRDGEEIGDYLVITLIVATTRTVFQPLSVMNADELKKLLTTLGSLSARELLAVEVLWTPQNTTDVLTEDDLLVGYPELKPVS